MMLSVYIASCLLLGFAFYLLSIARLTGTMVAQLRSSFAVLVDSSLDDEAKEKAIRRQSIKVLGTTTRLSLGLAAVFAAAYLPIYLADRTGRIDQYEFVAYSIQPAIVAATLLVCAVWAWAGRRGRRSR